STARPASDGSISSTRGDGRTEHRTAAATGFVGGSALSQQAVDIIHEIPEKKAYQGPVRARAADPSQVSTPTASPITNTNSDQPGRATPRPLRPTTPSKSCT